MHARRHIFAGIAGAALLSSVAASLAVSGCAASDAGAASDPTGGTGAGDAASGSDANGGSANDASKPSDGGADTSAPGDSASPPSDGATVGDAGSYRTSLHVCWNDPACTRALAVSHGGDWNVAGPPYDSNAALAAAYTNGADGVKIDVRITKDNVPVISHSSPIQTYESLDCSGKKIEEMNASDVTACHRFPSNETFQRLDDVLDALRGKLVAQLCVKVNTDFGRTITAVLAKGAEDFAFIEVNSGDFPLIAPLPGSDKLYYLVNAASNVADVDTVLALHNPRVIMIELDPTVALSGMAASKIHPGGARAFTYDNSSTATAATLKALFDQGYDVVSSNLTAPDIQARVQVNQARGLTPP